MALSYFSTTFSGYSVTDWAKTFTISISFIPSDHFYSASSSPLLLRSAPNTARTLCLSFTPIHHSQLRVKDLPKVPTWRLERDSNPRPSGRKASTLPMSHHVPQVFKPIQSPLHKLFHLSH